MHPSFDPFLDGTTDYLGVQLRLGRSNQHHGPVSVLDRLLDNKRGYWQEEEEKQ